MEMDLFDAPKPAPAAKPLLEEMMQLQAKRLTPHPGIPFAMFGARACRRLWTNYKLTTYSAAQVGLTPSQACAVFEDREHVAMTEAKGRERLDQIIAHWRANRGR